MMLGCLAVMGRGGDKGGGLGFILNGMCEHNFLKRPIFKVFNTSKVSELSEEYLNCIVILILYHCLAIDSP